MTSKRTRQEEMANEQLFTEFSQKRTAFQNCKKHIIFNFSRKHVFFLKLPEACMLSKKELKNDLKRSKAER